MRSAKAANLNVFHVAEDGAGTAERLGQRVDRRVHHRITAHWVIRLARSGQMEVEACTVNVSSTGFCCLCPKQFAPGEGLTALLEIPGLDADRQIELLVLSCEAVVLRAEVLAEGSQWRLAGRILDYSILSAASAMSSARSITDD